MRAGAALLRRNEQVLACSIRAAMRTAVHSRRNMCQEMQFVL